MRNRMIRIKIASLMAGLVAAVSLEGCGLFTKSYDFTEAENSIYVEDNATIRAAMISDFDKDYYSIDELASVAQQEALSFNKNVYDCSYYSYDQMTKEEKESILLPVCYEKAASVRRRSCRISPPVWGAWRECGRVRRRWSRLCVPPCAPQSPHRRSRWRARDQR